MNVFLFLCPHILGILLVALKMSWFSSSISQSCNEIPKLLIVTSSDLLPIGARVFQLIFIKAKTHYINLIFIFLGLECDCKTADWLLGTPVSWVGSSADREKKSMGHSCPQVPDTSKKEMAEIFFFSHLEWTDWYKQVISVDLPYHF